MATKDLFQWQKEFFARPMIWTVYVPKFSEETGNYYDTKEAAEVEVAWLREHGHKNVRVIGHNIHNMELSERRWRRRFVEQEATDDRK